MKNAVLFLVFIISIGNVVANPIPKDSDLKLPEIFQNNMVLQRNKPITIWGWLRPGENVNISMAQNNASVKSSKKGKWKITLPQLEAGGPYVIKVTTSQDSIVLKNILMGDVWICAGQSNMWWPVKQTPYKETDSVWMRKPEIRLFTVRTAMDYMPENNLTGSGWQKLDEKSLANFSAVGYHFGKYLQQHIGVPIGLISDNLGATSIETWMSNDALLKFPQFKKVIGEQVKRGKSFEELNNDFKKVETDWKQDYESGIGMNQRWYLPTTDISDWKPIEASGNTWEDEPDLKNFNGAVWFRKNFDLPEGFKGDSLPIQLLQIDDYDITWVNGKKIGETFGNHNHRNYTVAANQLNKKDNVIVVRIFDVGRIGGFTTNKFWGNDLLWGMWLYKKGKSINPEKFKKPIFPNASPFSSPSVLYNANIAPITPLSIKGVIWYQGESNVDRAYEYRSLFLELIRDWRGKFGQGNFPFLFVQLANYGSEQKKPADDKWAELRESQSLALSEPNTGMVVAIDLGESETIHPLNKVDVGKRLGMLALSKAYGNSEIYTGPTYKEMKVEGNKVKVDFKSTGHKLITKNKYGYIRGFQIAGADKKFYWAKAYLEGNTIWVYSDSVSQPVAIRYAWSQNPGCLDLYNDLELPAVPFRTDNWELSTKGKVFEDGPLF